MTEKITSTVEDSWTKIKELNGWTWKEIIGAGILAKKNNPQLLERIHSLEHKFIQMNKRINIINTEIYSQKK